MTRILAACLLALVALATGCADDEPTIPDAGFEFVQDVKCYEEDRKFPCDAPRDDADPSIRFVAYASQAGFRIVITHPDGMTNIPCAPDGAYVRCEVTREIIDRMGMLEPAEPNSFDPAPGSPARDDASLVNACQDHCPNKSRWVFVPDEGFACECIASPTTEEPTP